MPREEGHLEDFWSVKMAHFLDESSANLFDPWEMNFQQKISGF
jgi:hypothetical protein